jgi:hypothetical protein
MTKAKEKKYIAVQEGCNNIIEDYDSDNIFNDLDAVKLAVESAIEDDYCGYDSNQGEVIIYELVPVCKARTPKDVEFVKI